MRGTNFWDTLYMVYLSSRTLKCQISLMIYRKTHHVSWIIRWKRPMILNLRSSENAPAYTLASNEGVIKAIVNFLPRWFRYGLSSSFSRSTSQYSKGVNFDWVNGRKCWTLARENVSRITQDLRNGGPLGMISIAKPLKTKFQFSVFSFRFQCLIYIICSFLQCSYQTAALQHFFGKCRTILSPRGPKGAKKENNNNKKQKTRRCGNFLSGMLFTLYELFASLGLSTFAPRGPLYPLLFARIGCLLQLWIKKKSDLGDAQVKKKTTKKQQPTTTTTTKANVRKH